MRYLIIALGLLMSSSASAEHIISNSVSQVDRKGTVTSYVWNITINGDGFNICYADLKIFNVHGATVHKESMAFPIQSKNGYASDSRYIAVSNSKASLFRSTDVKFRCF